jgi:hypothetical protein
MVLFKNLSVPRTAPRKRREPCKKLCKNPWTIWTKRAKSNHPYGIDRVLGRRPGAAGAKSRSWKVLERLSRFRAMSMGYQVEKGNPQLFSMTLGVGPLSGRAGNAAFAREGK